MRVGIVLAAFLVASLGRLDAQETRTTAQAKAKAALALAKIQREKIAGAFTKVGDCENHCPNCKGDGPCCCLDGCVCSNCWHSAYKKQRELAVKQKRAFVVFVGVPAKKGNYTRVHVPANWKWVKGSGIVVSIYRDGDLQWVRDLPADADADDIEQAIREVSEPRTIPTSYVAPPTPFYEPRPLFQPTFQPMFQAFGGGGAACRS